MTEKTVYIYALCDPQTDEVRYIGKTEDPEKRLWAHLSGDNNLSIENAKAKWLKGLSERGIKPAVKILEEVLEDNWRDIERKWIAHFTVAGADLTNTVHRRIPSNGSWSISSCMVLSSAEAAVLWGLGDSTLRKAMIEGRLSGQKSGGTWLISTEIMQAMYGDPKPEVDETTLGQVFYVQADTTPLVSLGRVPGQPGRHVLQAPDGSIVVCGGYYLRRPEEIWEDFIDIAMPA